MTKCEKIKQEYENLKTLKQEFNLEMEKAVEIGELGKAKELKARLEQQRDALAEKLWLFENLPQKELKKQYEEQISAYRQLGLLERLTNGKEGIKDEYGEEHALPSFAEISNMMRENKEFLRKKTEQGFIRLQLTPFALPIDRLKERYGELIRQKHKEGNLKGENNDPLDLDQNQPVYMNENFKSLLYFPEWETKGNKAVAKGGITKKEAIKQTGGWRIILDEDLSIVPVKGQGKTIKDRKQIEGGMLASEQFQLIKKQKEEGYTPEDWFAFAIIRLSKENKVIDDDRETNYICRLLGVCFSTSGQIPSARWGRVYRLAGLVGSNPEGSYSVVGVRAGVRVKKS